MGGNLLKGVQTVYSFLYFLCMQPAYPILSFTALLFNLFFLGQGLFLRFMESIPCNINFEKLLVNLTGGIKICPRPWIRAAVMFALEPHFGKAAKPLISATQESTSCSGWAAMGQAPSSWRAPFKAHYWETLGVFGGLKGSFQMLMSVPVCSSCVQLLGGYFSAVSQVTAGSIVWQVPYKSWWVIAPAVSPQAGGASGSPGVTQLCQAQGGSALSALTECRCSHGLPKICSAQLHLSRVRKCFNTRVLHQNFQILIGRVVGIPGKWRLRASAMDRS